MATAILSFTLCPWLINAYKKKQSAAFAVHMVWIDPKESISQTMERTFQTISVEWYAKGLLTPVKTKFFSTLGSGVPFTLDVNTELNFSS